MSSNIAIFLKKRHTDDSMSPIDIIDAAENGRLDRVIAALAGGADVNQQEPGTGITALHAASVRGEIDIVRHLLDVEGLDLDIVDARGRTAHLAATSASQVEVARLIYARAFPENIHPDDPDNGPG